MQPTVLLRRSGVLCVPESLCWLIRMHRHRSEWERGQVERTQIWCCLSLDCSEFLTSKYFTHTKNKSKFCFSAKPALKPEPHGAKQEVRQSSSPFEVTECPLSAEEGDYRTWTHTRATTPMEKFVSTICPCHLPTRERCSYNNTINLMHFSDIARYHVIISQYFVVKITYSKIIIYCGSIRPNTATSLFKLFSVQIIWPVKSMSCLVNIFCFVRRWLNYKITGNW